MKNVAQQLQDEHFRNMSAEEKIRLTAEFSELLIKLNTLGKNYESPGHLDKNYRDSRKA